MEDIPSILPAALAFSALVLLRVKVMGFRTNARGRQFHIVRSLRMLLHVLSSLAVPGLGQAMRGRTEIAFVHLGIFVLAFTCMGEAALIFNIGSAMEHAFT
ncbi:hypothetical protein [Prosthecobacter sp.]|uniref:hypothetical protein n=1 Tax=Prosthecobacter sp. TaxID=1965333 RepID=UPI003784F11C